MGRLCAFRSERPFVQRSTPPRVMRSTPTTNGEAFAVGHVFTSEPMKVFIEDTDTYGVVYNANYLKFYDRALFAAGSFDGGGVLISVGNQKFRSSPGLGDDFVIEGVLKDTDDADRQVWDLSMKSLDGNIVFHSAEDVIVVVAPNAPGWLTPQDPFGNSGMEARSDSFLAFRDEFDPSMLSHLPLTSVLNHMERPRTNVLGGPKALRQLKDDDDILIVVSGIKDLCLLDHNKEALIGDRLTVQTFCEIYKGGMKTDVYQTLYNSNGERIAQGIVTLLALNKKTFRPTSKIPEHVMDKIRRNGVKYNN